MPMHLKWRPRKSTKTNAYKAPSVRLTETLDRTLANPPQPVTSLKDMSPEKQAELRALYQPPRKP